MPLLSKMEVEWNLELYFGYWILTDAELKDSKKKVITSAWSWYCM